ncbi:MAG: hypothetical protein JO053_11500 [Acidobacteria bacterium]|nr:hypothetical protein [Acidobacteriota bacterium]
MPLMVKAASIGGSILVILALLVAVLKGVITLIAFVTGAIKLLLILAFIFVFAAVGYMVFRSWQARKTT